RVLAEPLLAPPRDGAWTVLWSSEEPLYGGGGTAPVEQPCGAWRLPGQAALVLGPAEDFQTKSDGTGGNTTPVIVVSKGSETDSRSQAHHG
ncbi:MAG: malto-oligosyltrehalose trehalohydrolase, partial [Alphaproteobacteria bacterium]